MHIYINICIHIYIYIYIDLYIGESRTYVAVTSCTCHARIYAFLLRLSTLGSLLCVRVDVCVYVCVAVSLSLTLSLSRALSLPL